MNDPRTIKSNPPRGLMVGWVRRAVIAALSMLMFGILAILLQVVLMRVFGSVQGWQAWRADNYWPLLVWRLMIYLAVGVAWYRLKARVLIQESRGRLTKVEIMAALLVVLIETCRLAFPPEVMT